jgi:hypothetical protein
MTAAREVIKAAYLQAVGMSSGYHSDEDDVADAILAALSAAGFTPPLPIEATEHSICLGDEAIIEALNEIPSDVKFTKGTPALRCWRAMVTAATEPQP